MAWNGPELAVIFWNRPDMEYSSTLTIQDCVKMFVMCQQKFGGYAYSCFHAIGAKGEILKFVKMCKLGKYRIEMRN